MPDLTDADIARMRELLAKATPAPWTVAEPFGKSPGFSLPYVEVTREAFDLRRHRERREGVYMYEVDGELLTLLRNHADALLAAASRERAARERMEAAEALIMELSMPLPFPDPYRAAAYRKGNLVKQAEHRWLAAKATGGAGEGEGQ